MTVACFTSFSLQYLPRARVLAETLRAAHPGWRLWAVLVDRPPPGFADRRAFDAFDGVVDAEDLAIPRVRAWLFGHGLVEACTAVKGAMLLHLLHLGAEKVVYLDPDIAVFHPLAALEARLEAASVLLTPHQVAPNIAAQETIDGERTAMRYGVYNLGFLGVGNDAPGRAFAAWWAARLHQACFDDVAHGVFTDQKYADLVPALFDRVAIERDPGWNVASWNLSRRQIAIGGDGRIAVDGSPLAFYHFSKHGAVGDLMTDRYAGARHEPHELWRWYGRRLAAHAQPGIPPGWWAYARFSDGTPIPYAARVLFRERADLHTRFDDPFDADGYLAWLRDNEPALLSG